MEALPRVDLETAQDLQRCQQTSDGPLRAPPAEASSSAIDADQHGSSAAGSHTEDAQRKEHILLRRPRQDPAMADDRPDAEGRDGPSVWDSYDAEEEALLMQGSPGAPSHAADNRPSLGRSRAKQTHQPSGMGADIPGRETHTDWTSGRSSAGVYHNDVVPFSKKEALQESRARSPARNGTASSMPESSGRVLDSFAIEEEEGQRHQSRAAGRSTQLSHGRHPSRQEGEDGGFLPSTSNLPRQSEGDASMASLRKPKGRRGAADLDLSELPLGLKAAEHRGHPWIRCRHFALVPLARGQLCSIRDVAGYM